MFLGGSAVVYGLAAQLVFADVAALFGRIVRSHVEAKEDCIADKTARALRALNFQLHRILAPVPML